MRERNGNVNMEIARSLKVCRGYISRIFMFISIGIMTKFEIRGKIRKNILFAQIEGVSQSSRAVLDFVELLVLKKLYFISPEK